MALRMELRQDCSLPGCCWSACVNSLAGGSWSGETLAPMRTKGDKIVKAPFRVQGSWLKIINKMKKLSKDDILLLYMFLNFIYFENIVKIYFHCSGQNMDSFNRFRPLWHPAY